MPAQRGTQQPSPESSRWLIATVLIKFFNVLIFDSSSHWRRHEPFIPLNPNLRAALRPSPFGRLDIWIRVYLCASKPLMCWAGPCALTLPFPSPWSWW